MKNFLIKWWTIIVAFALILFDIGYTMARLDNKPDRIDVSNQIDQKILDYKNETKNNYIKIDQVPGLIERLNSIDQKLGSIEKRIEKIENKIWR